MRRVSTWIVDFFASKFLWSVIAVFAIGLSAATQWLPDAMRLYPGDEWLRDRFVQLRASALPETRISLVDIDEASIAALGPWPWPRTRVADLIERLLADDGARGVALDIIFSEAGNAEGDLRLAMLGEHGPIVFAQAFDYASTRPWPLRTGTLAGGMAAPDYPGGRAAVASGYIGNHDLLGRVRFVGNIGFVPDRDGTLRRIPPVTRFENRVYPALSRALFDCCAQGGSIAPFVDARSADVDSDGFSRVEFGRQLSSYTVLSAASILENSAPRQLLRDRLVIVGSSALGLSDRVATPLFFSTSGFLVHASALSSLLDQQQGQPYVKWPGKWLALLFTVVIASGAAYAFPRFSALANTLMLGAASALWLLFSYPITAHDMWFSPTGPIWSNFFLLAVAVPFGWQTAQQKSRRLLGTLQQYVAKAVVHELLRSDLKDPLAPRRLHVTTLIADMEGYTSQVEHLPMEDAANLTRQFLECLTGPVLATGGTLDKYTGDGLVAFWGAPLPLQHHADFAVDAAIEIVKNVRNLSQKRMQQGFSSIRVRIGIESGIAIAGDFGSSLRSIYTAVGDSVNTASRLEDAARHYPHDVVIGKGTVDGSTRHQFRLLGERMLRGKEKPTTLFTVDIPE